MAFHAKCKASIRTAICCSHWWRKYHLAPQRALCGNAHTTQKFANNPVSERLPRGSNQSANGCFSTPAVFHSK
jgi:hypothetical protein